MMTSIRLPTRSGLRYRFAQGLEAVRARPAPDANNTLQALLSPEQISVFKRLSAYDQRHSLRVLALVSILDSGRQATSDLEIAALLHDIGKAGPNGRVRMPDRILRVVLGRLSPGLWARLSHVPASAWRTGMALAEHHPVIGAREAARIGCSLRTCWLVEHHADSPTPDDDDLRRLVAADHVAR